MTENILTKFVLKNGSNLLFNEQINKQIRKGLETSLGHLITKEERVIVNMLFTTFIILAEERTNKECQEVEQAGFNNRADYIVSLIKNYMGFIDEQSFQDIQTNKV